MHALLTHLNLLLQSFGKQLMQGPMTPVWRYACKPAGSLLDTCMNKYSQPASQPASLQTLEACKQKKPISHTLAGHDSTRISGRRFII